MTAKKIIDPNALPGNKFFFVFFHHREHRGNREKLFRNHQVFNRLLTHSRPSQPIPLKSPRLTGRVRSARGDR
jgi:hypothetical protein